MDDRTISSGDLNKNYENLSKATNDASHDFSTSQEAPTESILAASVPNIDFVRPTSKLKAKE